ncbi:MAG: gliding motility-associated C-terminal domain-containing protein [Bacteroidota bacterium]
MPRTLAIIITLLTATISYSQICGPGTPTYIVDLSYDPNANWISPDTVRNDTCCGATGVRCIQFIITLHNDAEGLIFDIYSGAIPPGALFYQVDCSSPTALGGPICLTGPGPYYITFCKPGANVNEYMITSISEPGVSDAIVINDGCNGKLYAFGYEPSSIIWASIFPDTAGAYDSYMSCTTGCDTTYVSAQPGYPLFIDYQVCGSPLGTCDTNLYCDTVRVIFNPTLFANISPVNPTICTGNPGITLTATPTGGTPPYSYSWNTGDTTQSIFAGAGVYIVTISDTSGCPPAYDTVTVSDSSALVLTVDSLSAACGFPNGEASVSVSGGNSPFTYLWNDPLVQTDSVATGLVPGIYTVIVSDSSGCMDSAIVIINSPGTFSASISDSSNINCYGDNNGSATVSLSGGAPPFTYLWDDPLAQTDSVATGLSGGTYISHVTDFIGCEAFAIVTLTEPDALITTIAGTPSVTCNGFCDGDATVTVSGGAGGTYTYLWDDGAAQTTTTATGFCAGIYTVTVTDSNNCDTVDAITIIEYPLLTASITGTDITCFGNCDGIGAVTPSGGTGSPYTYLWDDGTAQTTATATGLCAGNYTVIVADGDNCDTTKTITITEPAVLSAPITLSTDVSCYEACDGDAMVSATGGTGSYTYLWNDGAAQSTATATGLCGGNYTVIVTDSNNCNSNDNITIIEPPELSASVTGNDIACYGLCDGDATVTASGGAGGTYTYLWNDISSQTTPTATGLCADNYTVTVTDSNNCDTIDAIAIIEPPLLTASITGTDITCNGICDGITAVSVSGGTGGTYNYLWNDGATQTTATATGLCAGNYTVIVTDSNNCDTTKAITITEPAVLSAPITSSTDVSCYGDCDGDAMVSVTGGTGSYTYLWNDGAAQSTATATGLCAGNYIVIVTDSNNCNTTDTITITEPPQLLASVTGKDIICYGLCDGYAIVSASGGTGAYTYLWDAGGQTSDTATGLCAGNYTVTVTDSINCDTIKAITINEPNELIETIAGTDISCNGNNDGAADLTVTGGTPPYSYSWSNSAVTEDISGLSQGIYSVTVTDSMGCDTTDSVTISDPSPLTADITSSTDVSCNGGSDGEATAAASGGTSAYTYSWSPSGGSGSTASGLSAGTYSVTVSDSNGCDTSVNVIIEEPTAIVPVLTKKDVSCEGNDGIASVDTISGGVDPYTYNWSNGATTKDISGLSDGIYTITITDANNCSVNDNVIISREECKISVPTAFTPNGNGINDTWVIKNLEDYPDCTVRVYNRWGDQVFISRGYETPWEGKHTLTRTVLPPAVYYYVIENVEAGHFETGSSPYGWITMVR